MTLSADEIVQLSKRYTLYDWSAQSKVAPMAVDRAEGVYFYGATARATSTSTPS